jgi:hypothetical protein
MKIISHTEIKTSHHVVMHDGDTYHRKEKHAFDTKEKKWVRQSLVWERRYANLENDKTITSKQLEREFLLKGIGI